MSEKIYEFRTLCSKDIFPMSKLINKIGFKNFKSCFQSDDIKQLISEIGKDDSGKGVEAVGMSVIMDIASIVLENLPSCENEIYDMLANVSNMKRKDIEKLDMGTFFEMIVDFIKKPEFKDFISVVSKLFK